MALIDIGSAVGGRVSCVAGAKTLIVMENPANDSGNITSIEIWAAAPMNGTNHVATFSKSGSKFTPRDVVTIGTVAAGSKQTFTVTLGVSVGDYIGIYYSAGEIERDSAGVNHIWGMDGDYTGSGEQTFSDWGALTISLGATGETLPVAPTVTTQAVSAVDVTTATGNGNITDTGGSNPTTRGFCYKTGTSGDPTVADSTAYDTGSFGTGAYTKGLTGLTGGTGYRVRAYAINSADTSYGATVQLTTDAGTSIKTINGVAYADIKTINGVAIADIKSVLGVSNVS